MTKGALSGLRVLDLTDWRGVLTGRMLAILGAEVVQVEGPGGSDARAVPPFDDEGGSLFWAAYGAGRQSLVLDRTREADRLMPQRIDGHGHQRHADLFSGGQQHVHFTRGRLLVNLIS